MRLSELIGAPVSTPDGEGVGVVRDVLVERVPPGRAAGASYPLRGLVVGRPGLLDEAAHAWGFAEGRASGPAVLRLALHPTCRRARFAPVDDVSSWGPGRIELSRRLENLPALKDVVP